MIVIPGGDESINLVQRCMRCASDTVFVVIATNTVFRMERDKMLPCLTLVSWSGNRTGYTYIQRASTPTNRRHGHDGNANNSRDGGIER